MRILPAKICYFCLHNIHNVPVNISSCKFLESTCSDLDMHNRVSVYLKYLLEYMLISWQQSSVRLHKCHRFENHRNSFEFNAFERVEYYRYFSHTKEEFSRAVCYPYMRARNCDLLLHLLSNTDVPHSSSCSSSAVTLKSGYKYVYVIYIS